MNWSAIPKPEYTSGRALLVGKNAEIVRQYDSYTLQRALSVLDNSTELHRSAIAVIKAELQRRKQGT